MSTSTPGDLSNSITRLSGRVDLLERSVQGLEASIDDRMSRMESALQASNAHLDNISHEASRTNSLLEGLLSQWTRQEDRLDKREESNRTIVTSAAREVWDTFKHPIGYALAAIATWCVIHLGEPAPASLPPSAAPPAVVLPPAAWRDEP